MLDRSEASRLERSTLLKAIAPLIGDLGSTLVFYAFFVLTKDAGLAALLGIALGAGQLIVARLRKSPIAILQWASFALVLALSTITLLTNDPRFVLFKATLVYGIIGGSMLTSGWMVRYIPPIAVADLPAGLLRRFELVWAALMLGTGMLNFALVLAISPQRGATFMVIWAAASKLVLFAIQYVWCRAVARPAIKARMQNRSDGEPA